MSFFSRRPRLNVVELHGVIAARPGSLNLASVQPLIERAFATCRGRPVILDIDSPGGSPVQSDLIARIIRKQAMHREVRVHAVITEAGASGGYWIACAADEIHANPMSIVGSIGVRGGGFGFPALMARLGVEQRLYTAGENKARFDPFQPERPEDVAFARELMDRLHDRFKNWVRTRRGQRLRAPDSTLFDGSFMLGEQALAVGLIDSLSDVDTLARQLGGDKVRVRRFAPKRRGWLARLPRRVMESALDVAEERAWRPGLW